MLAILTFASDIWSLPLHANRERSRANGDPKLPRGEHTPARWFRTEAFLNPSLMAPGQFGTGGRNIFIGPGFQNWDISLLRNFQLQEQTRMQFRAESFDIFNHPNFTGINTTVRFDSAGKPTGGFGAVN